MRSAAIGSVIVLALGCSGQPRLSPDSERVLREYQEEPKRWDEPATDLEALTPEGVADATSRRVDKYKALVILESPELYSGWKRNRSRTALVHVSSETGPLETYLRVATESFDGWNFFESAFVLGGTELKVIRDRSDTGTFGGSAETFETYLVTLTDEVLKRGAADGLSLELSGRQRMEVRVPAAVVTGFLRRLEEERRNPKSQPVPVPGGP